MNDAIEIPRVDDQNYPAYLSVPAAVVVFGIASCIPCNEFDPILKKAAEKYGASVKFGKAQMHVPGACREIKKQYSFETFPTSHFYKNGVLVHTADEKLEYDELIRRIDQYLLV